MYTPYDWQEGIGHRAQYVEGKLAQGMPVIAFSHPDGIVIATYRRQARKIFEIYDRLAFSAIGQQSDVEALRVAAVEFTHKEGYNRSEQDVTIQRVVAALSQPLKRAFGDFNSAPVVARSLFAELGSTPEEDLFFVLDYDGDYIEKRLKCVVCGSVEEEKQLDQVVSDVSSKPKSIDKAVKALEDAWPSRHEEEPLGELVFEVGILERNTHRETKFRLLS